MRTCALLLAVMLVGCSRTEITLDAEEWTCTRSEVVTWMRPQPVGKTVILVPAQRRECVVYERKGWR